jgi:hypothetical protein
MRETPEFCDRCGSVCDARCRSEALRDHTVQRAILYGQRF